MIYFQKFSITGEANKVAYDSGLESSTENPKRLLSVLVQVDDYQGNDVQGWYEREKIFEIPDSLIDTVDREADTMVNKSFNRINEIEVGYDIPPGSTFKAAISCGGTKSDLKGAYRYEIVS